MKQTEKKICRDDLNYGLFFNEYPDVVDVVQLGRMLGGISTKTCYELLSSGQIKAMKIGRAYRIPKINVMKYLKIV